MSEDSASNEEFALIELLPEHGLGPDGSGLGFRLPDGSYALVLRADGEILVRGHAAGSNKEVVDAFKLFLSSQAKRKIREPKKCHDCGVLEGQFHVPGCDMERCPFCGRQLITCGCCYKHFYPSYTGFRMPDDPEYMSFNGLPEAVYRNGLPKAQSEEWERVLQAKGLVPYISYPLICAKCGDLWPDMFMVPGEEWEKYIELGERDKILCRPCFDWIKSRIDTCAAEIKSNA